MSVFPALSEEAPAVAIVMPAFNAARTIGRAIDSVVAQGFRSWRLICVDDASDDDTAAILAGYAPVLGPRLHRLRMAENGGPARARNVALDAVREPWVTILDADDSWHPERLARLMAAAGSQGADVICDNIMGFDDHLGRETAPLFARLPQRLDIATLVAAEFQGRYNLGYLKPMIRCDLLRRHGISYDEDLRTGEDLLFLMTVLLHARAGICIDVPSYVYTLPVNPRGRLSRSTNTVPRDADMGKALQRFLDDYGERLSHGERTAIGMRIRYLREIATLSLFRHARLAGRWDVAFQVARRNPGVIRQLVLNRIRAGWS